jgi:hypothetical protein
VNSGLITLNPVSLGSTNTIIVTGVGRSGTSMTAHVLQAAGVPMGNTNRDVFEDMDLGGVIGRGDEAAFRRALALRELAHQTFGFKRPNLHGSLFHEPHQYRRPRFVVMIRDPVAMAVRIADADRISIGSALDYAVREMTACLAWARGLTCPVLLVSYEKALMQPHAFLGALLPFCGVDASLAGSLIGLIEPERAGYAVAAE